MEKLLFFTSYEVIVFGEWKKDDQMTLSFDYGVGLLRELIISEAVVILYATSKRYTQLQLACT